MNNPLISIIIPVYNMEEYLDECVQSVINQSYQNLEILLVDDGSKDKSPQMCDNYSEQDNRVKSIHKENGGLISAWTAGVRESGGEYLCFIDSDDWVDLNMIADLSAHLTGSRKEIVCSNYIIEKRGKSIPVIQTMKPGVYDRAAIESEIFPALLGNEYRRIHCSRCMKLFSRQLFTDNMIYCNFDLTMGEDFNIVLPTILDAERIAIVENGLYYHYRFVDASMVHKYNEKYYSKIQLLYSTLKNVLTAKKDSLPSDIPWEENLKKEYVFFLFQVLKNELRRPDSQYAQRIIQICRETQPVLNGISVDVSSMANQLLYFIFKNPQRIRILIGRIAIKIFDKLS